VIASGFSVDCAIGDSDLTYPIHGGRRHLRRSAAC